MGNKEIIKFKNIKFYKHPEYEKYLASKCGKILSLKRKEKKILKLQINGWGYYQFGLYENNIKKIYRVSRFIFECFKGEIPLDKDVDHINNDKKNNSISNLQLLSHKENVRKSCCKKVVSLNIKTKEEKIFNSLKETAEYHQISDRAVCYSCQKKIKIIKSKKDGKKYKFSYL